MNIVVIAPGSRGDVQPYVALGKGLQAAGHAVRILATQDFQQLVTDQGLGFVDMGGSAETGAQLMQDIVEQGNLLKILASTGRGAKQLAHQAAVSGFAACQDADLLVGGLGGLFVGQALSEKLAVPFLQAHLLPLTPTSEFPSVLAPFPTTRLTRWANGLSHRLTQQMIWQMFRAADNNVRAELHLTPAPLFGPFAALERQAQPILYGYSPQVLPPPADWNDSIHVTGYWFLEPPPAWEPPADLVAFLHAGSPAIYIGFGSMPSSNPAATTDLVVQALARSGQRGVLSAGWGGLKKEQLPENVFMIGSIPHSWLFPHMAAVVHHGGAGTTAAGLAAGVPSIVTPFFGDQPFWGQRVHALGVGPQPIPRRRLTASNLAEAIDRAVSDTLMRTRAAALGARIRAEDGIARAVAIIEQHSTHA
ncbi:MAG: glycosyltransferase family 1 protein [Roseiflexaceae bacterium]|nr:glycosyltransferase family 1 protein [Roseiflexaceae bacterium]